MKPAGVLELLGATSVAVIGASDDVGHPGGRVLSYLRERFSGHVYPIHRSRASVQGMVCYRSVEDAPPADLAVIGVGAANVEEAISSCARAGVRWAVVFAAGFADAGEDGLRRQQALLERARAEGMRIVGPNTMGILDCQRGLFATFATRVAALELASAHLGLVSQSGAVGSALLSDLAAANVGCRYFVHSGNEADLALGEVIGAYVASPDVSVIGVYLESVRDPQSFMRALRDAQQAGKAVVVLRAATSEMAAAAAASHTGALVGTSRGLDAVLNAYDVIRPRAPFEMVDMLQCLVRCSAPDGPRTLVVTLSGGGGVMQADAAAGSAVVLAALPPALADAVGKLVPAYAKVGNPLDLTGAPIARPELLGHVLDQVELLGDFDAVSVHLSAGERAAAALTDVVLGAAKRSTKPFVVTWQGVERQVLAAVSAGGVPAFDDPVRAMRALGAIVSWGSARRSALCSAPLGGSALVEPGFERGHLAPRDAPSDGVRSGVFVPLLGGALPAAPLPTDAFDGAVAPGGSTSVPSDAAGLQGWLKRHGIDVVDTRYVRSPSDAAGALAELGRGLVVAKVVAPGLAHRSDLGLVRLGIHGVQELEAAIGELLGAARQAGCGEPVAVQIQPQIASSLELLVGMERDPQFGWLVVIGFGGVLAEIVDEVVVLLAPATVPSCERAIDGLFDGRLVSHPRGLHPVTRRAVARVASSLSQTVCEQRSLRSVELNPLVVHGDHVLAVDWAAEFDVGPDPLASPG